MLTPEQVQQFNLDGVLPLRNFYDLERDIQPIQLFIHRIIGILIRKHQLPIQQRAFSSESFDDGYQALLAYDRRIGGEVYDAVKQIPEFVRLVADERHSALFSQLRGTDMPGIAGGGFGIRIDNPAEERYRADWHQEYPAQLRSLDGLVFWSPLVEITEPMGPVCFCVSSHQEGLVTVHTKDPNHHDKTGAYGLVLTDKEERLARYRHIAPLTRPTDLIICDFLTLHSSGYNRAERSRWSMQFRYFNFLDPTGVRNGWCGSYAAGVEFQKIHPELVAGTPSEV
jgi:hypothetical protein